MEFVIYALLLAAGFVGGFFTGKSKKTDPAPIVLEQPKKRAYVRKAKEAGPSASATVNVSKSLANGKDHGASQQ